MKRGVKLVFLLVFAFISISIFSSYVSANILSASVTPTSGETGIYQVYNFTITNTNSPPRINFTQVVISAPSSIIISNHGSSASGDFSYSSNPVSKLLSWNNSAGLIENGTTRYFWINASLTKYAYYNFTVAALDTAGNTNQTTLTVLSNDTIPPSLDFITPPTPSTNTNMDQDYLPIKVSSSDSGSGLSNITIYLYNSTEFLIKKETNSTSPFFYNFTGLNYSTYKVAAIAWDLAGNYKVSPTLTLVLENSSASNPLQCTNTNWSCSWGSCINGTKTQKCIDLSGCNSTILINQTASCSSSSSDCSPLLNCTDWLPACSSGVKEQTKTCTDLNNCTSPSVTVTTRNCTAPVVINFTNESSPSTSFNLGVSPSVIAFSAVLVFIIVIIIVVISFLRKMRNS